MSDQDASLRVLVVEDEVLITMLLEDMLESLGHVMVGSATSLDQALELAGREDEAIDAAIVDLVLQGERTSQVVEVLRARNVAIVVSTGHADFGGEAAMSEPVLVKPYSQAQLGAALARAMRSRQ
jgi:CheY-like chemotaxis protein